MNDFKLDKEPKINTGFKTPDGYFDDFSQKLMQQLPPKEPEVISIFAKRKTWLYAAAAVLVIALTIPIINQNQTPELDEATLENYLAGNAGISEMELVDLLQEEDINKIKLDQNMDDKAIEDILVSNPNLEEYLTN